MKYLIVVIISFLIGAQASALGLYHPDMNKRVSTITWVRDAGAVEAKFKEIDENYKGDLIGETVGYAEWRGNKCKIWALEPINEEDFGAMANLGHEMLHCFRGDYHDE